MNNRSSVFDARGDPGDRKQPLRTSGSSSQERQEHPGELPSYQGTGGERSSSIGSQKRHITPLRYKSGSREREALRASLSQSPSVNEYNRYYPGAGVLGGSVASGAEFINSPSTTNRAQSNVALALQAQHLRDSFQRRLNVSTSNLHNTTSEVAMDHPSSQHAQHSSSENKHYIDSEMKVALMDIKNNLFEQQFGFERQICNLVNKLTAELKSFQARQDAQEDLQHRRGRQEPVPQQHALSPSEVRLMINEETGKVHKLLVEDVTALQKWVDSLLEGVESLKRSQEEVHKQLVNDMRTNKEEIAKVKVDDRGLDSLERQIQELFRLIAKKESGNTSSRDDASRTQTFLKQSLQRMQDQLDGMHKTLFEKPDKSSIDSNFMVLQNEMDNLNVKLKFHEHKNAQLEENLRGMISGYNSEMAQEMVLMKEQGRNEGLVAQTQLKGFQEYVTERLRGVEETLATQNQKILALQPSIFKRGNEIDDEDKVSQLREEVMPKLAELSNLCFRNQTSQDKLTVHLNSVEQDLRKKLADVLNQIKSIRGGEEHGERLGELVVTIEADLKRRLADQSGQLNQVKLEVQKLNAANANVNAQQIQQVENDLRKRVGEALVQMVSLKSDLHLTMNEKFVQVETEVRRKLQESSSQLQGIKNDIISTSQELYSPTIAQLERKVQDNRTMLGALKNELLMELHERVSQQTAMMDQDLKRRSNDVQQQLAEIQSANESRSSLSGLAGQAEQDLRRKVAELSNQLIYIQSDIEVIRDSQTQVAQVKAQVNEHDRKMQGVTQDIDDLRKQTGIQSSQVTTLDRKLNDLSIKHGSELRELQDSLASNTDDLKQLVSFEGQSIRTEHDRALGDHQESVRQLLTQSLDSQRKLLEDRLSRFQTALPPLSDRVSDLESSLAKLTSRQTASDTQHKELAQTFKDTLSRDLEASDSRFRAELDSLKGQFKLIKEGNESYQTENDRNVGDIADEIAQVKEVQADIQQALTLVDSTKSAVEGQHQLMQAFQKKMDELRQQQKEKIEFVHADLNSQMSYEAQSRAAMQNQVKDIANAMRENLEEQVLKYASMEEVAKMRSDSRDANEVTKEKIEILITSVKDLTGTQTALIDSFSGFKQQTAQGLGDHSATLQAISESLQKVADKLAYVNKDVKALKDRPASAPVVAGPDAPQVEEICKRLLTPDLSALTHRLADLESAATQRLDSVDSRVSSLAKGNQEQFDGLSTRWLEIEEHVHGIKEAQKAREAKVDERLVMAESKASKIAEDLTALTLATTSLQPSLHGLKTELDLLRVQNTQDHDALLSRVTLLTSKQDAKEGEISERLDNADRCIDLLKESVESLEAFFEKGLQSAMDRSTELEGAHTVIAGEVDTIKNAVAGMEERLDAMNLSSSSRVVTDGQESHRHRQDIETLHQLVIQRCGQLDDKLSGLSENVLELMLFRDNLNLQEQLATSRAEQDHLKQQLDGQQNELQLRSDATQQEIVKLKKVMHDEVDRRVEALSKEVQALSEHVDSLLGQIEGKVDQDELETFVRLDTFEGKVIELREQIDGLQQKENISILTDDEEQRKLKINELDAQMPQVQQRLADLMTKTAQLEGSLEQRVMLRLQEYDMKDGQLREEVQAAITGLQEQIQEQGTSQQDLATALNDIQELLNQLQAGQSQLEQKQDQQGKTLDDSAKNTAKQLATMSHSIKDSEIEREKSNMRIEAVEKRLDGMVDSIESQITRASGELVATVERVEGEINKKMVQLRQLLDETKAVKQGTSDRVAELEAAIEELSQKPHEKAIELQAAIDLNKNQAKVDNKQLHNEVQALSDRLANAQLASSNLQEGAAPLIQDCLARIKYCEDKLTDVELLGERISDLESTQGTTADVQKSTDQLKLLVGNLSQQVQQDQAQLRDALAKVEKVGDLSQAVSQLQREQEGLKESSENHEERMTELEIKSNGIEEEQGTLRVALQEVKEQEARVENDMREGDLENRVRIDHMNEEMQQFYNGTVKHLEELEQKIADALANHTVSMQDDTQNAGVKKPKQLSSQSPSVMGLIPDAEFSQEQNTPSSTTLKWKQDHQQLLEEMRRKRNFYLRKTPVDARIDEIKRQYNCDHQQAIQICYDEMEQKRNRSINNSGVNMSQFGGANQQSPLHARDLSIEFLQPKALMNSIYNNYKNLLDKISPPRNENNRSREEEKEAMQMPFARSVGVQPSPINIQNQRNQTRSRDATPDLIRRITSQEDANINTDELDEDDMEREHPLHYQMQPRSPPKAPGLFMDEPPYYQGTRLDSITDQQFQNRPPHTSKREDEEQIVFDGASLVNGPQTFSTGRDLSGGRQQQLHDQSPLSRDPIQRTTMAQTQLFQNRPNSEREGHDPHKTPQFQIRNMDSEHQR